MAMVADGGGQFLRGEHPSASFVTRDCCLCRSPEIDAQTGQKESTEHQYMGTTIESVPGGGIHVCIHTAHDSDMKLCAAPVCVCVVHRLCSLEDKLPG